MELSEALRRRRSVRRFDPERPVAAETIDRILDAALRAPSAGHTQGVTVLALEEPDQIASYWRVTAGDPADTDDSWLRGMRTAPLLVTVWTSKTAYLDRYAEPDKGWTDRDESRWTAPYWWVDAGMAAMNVLLTVVDEGLGACFFGVPAHLHDAVRTHLGVPEDQLCVGVVAIGHPAGGGDRGSAATRPKLARDVRIRRGSWNAKKPADGA
jgi:nitroreductase